MCGALLQQPYQTVTQNVCLNSTEELSWSEPGWVVSQGAYSADMKLPGKANNLQPFPEVLGRLSVKLHWTELGPASILYEGSAGKVLCYSRLLGVLSA